MPLISFIIPTKPNSKVSALQSLEFASKYLNCEIIVSEGYSPSRQRNAAAQEAHGDILYFLDDDSHISLDSIDRSTKHFTNSKIAVVGGPSLTPPDNSSLQKLFGSALSSLFGSGTMRNRYASLGKPRLSSEKELILCNMAIRKDVFLQCNGFDERLYPNEENELLHRITSKGFQIIYDPNVAVHRNQRPTVFAFIKQVFTYGLGRGTQTRISNSIPIISTIPLFFVFYLVFLAVYVYVEVNPIVCMPFALYLIFSSVFAVNIALQTKSLYSMWLFFLFPIMHISNGCGLLLGLIRGTRNTSSFCKNQTITLHTVKAFDN